MSARFQVLFHSPPGVLFTIPSRYSSAIGHQEVFRQPSGLGGFTQDSTGPVLLGNAPTRPGRLRLQGCHPLRPPFPEGSATTQVCHRAHHRQTVEGHAPQPRRRNPCRVSHDDGLTIIRVRSPLLTEYPLLRVLRCFTSPRHPPRPTTRLRRGWHDTTRARSPHSETPGSQPASRLPEAYRRPPRPSSAPGAKASTGRS